MHVLLPLTIFLPAASAVLLMILRSPDGTVARWGALLSSLATLLLSLAVATEFQALPELDASGNAIAIESIKLENEGWERDLTLAEPAEL